MDRYRDVVPDWEDFQAALQRPEPRALRVRTGRISVDELRGRLEARGFRMETVDGLPDFLRVVEEPRSVSNTLEHWLGLFYVQQASTGVAAHALEPRPGERILDMCAAPGGKTTHMADLMDDRGTLVAGDVKERRLRALLGNVYRTAHTNVLVVSADGRRFPGGAAFDRVLVDAPCTAEGNVRRKGGRGRPPSPDFREFISGVQEELLRRAATLVRPGGRVLYSTCTFAPEENEAVVDRVLRDPAGGPELELEPLALAARHAPGLTAFGDREFDPRLRGAARIYPHHLDSGGLFLALLRRKGGGEGSEELGGGAHPEGWTPVPPIFPDETTDPEEARRIREEGLRRLRDEFSVPESELAGMEWMVRGDSVWMHGCLDWPLEAWKGAGDWRMVSLGLRALVDDGRGGVRPTNDFLVRLEKVRGDRVVTLSRKDCLRLLEGERLPVSGVSDGFVILRLQEGVVGRGLVIREELRHEVPKARAARLREILGMEMGRDQAGSVV